MSSVKSKGRSQQWGPRRRLREPLFIMQEAIRAYGALKLSNDLSLSSLQSIKEHFAKPSRSYYSLAALSRRAHLDDTVRAEAYKLLFPLRVLLEERIVDALRSVDRPMDTVLKVGCKSFFGKSIKQGLSIRYPLSTCVPTSHCGGRCYAHDGRDRDYQRVFRGALNGFVGLHYEGHPEDRAEILSRLSKQIDEVIALSRTEALAAAEDGYIRSARIRFSHVGEMAATPNFANDLARAIKTRAPDVSCVIYTRHPDAASLDAALFVVNFTVDGINDKRVEFLPANARLVSSSWDGKLFPEAVVNFLEHHVEKSSKSLGSGVACPVTENHKEMPTCDSARCERCFVRLPSEILESRSSCK